MSSEVGAAVPETGDRIRLSGADRATLDQLFERLYRRIVNTAARLRWNGQNPTLNPTALAHEAYLKLCGDPPKSAGRSDEEVIAIFAAAMHQILIDAARRKNARKRIAIPIPDPASLPIEDALTIAAALEELERDNPRQAQVARCRFLLGMTTEETALALRLTRRTVERDWQQAKERLSRRIYREK
jgi:RNA polymerase sigma factor (TIGR02999 family)